MAALLPLYFWLNDLPAFAFQELELKLYATIFQVNYNF